jgi:hypothetical protein
MTMAIWRGSLFVEFSTLHSLLVIPAEAGIHFDLALLCSFVGVSVRFSARVRRAGHFS